MIHSPEPLTARHDVSSFTCGEPSLDLWLRRRAMSNQNAGASKTYVIVEEGAIEHKCRLATVDERLFGLTTLRTIEL